MIKARRAGTVILLLTAACGSKSGLLEGKGAAGNGSASFGGSSGSSGTGGAVSGSGGSIVSGGGGSIDAGWDAPEPLPDCHYVQHGDPIVLFTYSEGVHTPSLVRLPGSPARLAFGLIHEHFWHPDIRVAEVTVGPEWPEGVTVTRPMTLYGIDAHAPGQLVASVSDTGGLALLYFHADEASPDVVPGVKFRRFDTATWKPLDEVFVEKWGAYAYAIAPGPLLGQNGAEAQGYAVTWRSQASGDAGSYVSSPLAAAIDELGTIVQGPIDVAPASAYPGIGATVAWSGQHYLVASNSRACSGDVPECTNRLTLGRLGKLELVETGKLSPNPGMRARSPLLRSWAGGAWVVWREQALDAKPENDPPSTLRLVNVAADGQLGGSIWQTNAHPDAGAELSISDQGVLLVWGERVDPKLPPQTIGHSRLRLRQFGKTGTELQEIELLTTSLTTGTAYSLATIAEPRALLVAWTAEDTEPASHPAAYLARFDCVEK